jgi:hypothetical protein
MITGSSYPFAQATADRDNASGLAEVGERLRRFLQLDRRGRHGDELASLDARMLRDIGLPPRPRPHGMAPRALRAESWFLSLI